MKPLTCCMSAIVLLAASAFAYADAKSDAAARAKAVAPFVEEETALVAHIDLTRVDPPSWLDLVARSIRRAPGELASAKRRQRRNWQTAIQAGVKEIYMVVTLGNRRLGCRSMFAVVPMPPGADVSIDPSGSGDSGRRGPSD